MLTVVKMVILTSTHNFRCGVTVSSAWTYSLTTNHFLNMVCPISAPIYLKKFKKIRDFLDNQMLYTNKRDSLLRRLICYSNCSSKNSGSFTKAEIITYILIS